MIDHGTVYLRCGKKFAVLTQFSEQARNKQCEIGPGAISLHHVAQYCVEARTEKFNADIVTIFYERRPFWRTPEMYVHKVQSAC